MKNTGKLDPYFCQAMFFDTPAGKPLKNQNADYRVYAYSQVGEYTLVQWQFKIFVRAVEGDAAEDIVKGETLWRGKTHVITSMRPIPLYEPPNGPERSGTIQGQVSVNDRLNKQIGKYGIPPAIAQQLRKNLIHMDI